MFKFFLDGTGNGFRALPLDVRTCFGKLYSGYKKFCRARFSLLVHILAGAGVISCLFVFFGGLRGVFLIQVFLLDYNRVYPMGDNRLFYLLSGYRDFLRQV